MRPNLLLVVAISLIFSACSGPYAPKTAKDAPQETERVLLLDHRLTRFLNIVKEKTSRTPGGQLKVRIDMENEENKDVWCDVQVIFRDGEGFEIEKNRLGTHYVSSKNGYCDSAAVFKCQCRGLSNPYSKCEVRMSDVEIATFAAGCFWGVEELVRQLDGVEDTTVGYTGGTLKNPTYEYVKRGDTGHAEAIQVRFDPSKISYEALLKFFFRLHDPTTLNRQGNDCGSQYRSAIFYENESQKEIAEKVKAEVDESGKWSSPIVTEISPAQEFYSAEEYHQDYLQKNPGGYTCHFVRD